MESAVDTSEIENIETNIPEFLDYIRNCGPEGLSEMIATRVIPSFLMSACKSGSNVFSNETVREWVCAMLLDGLKESTVRRYYGALHTLFKQWCMENGVDYDESVFSVPFAALSLEGSDKRIRETESNLEAAERLTRITVKQDSPAYVYNKAFQYLLFDPFISLQEIVGMKFSDKRPESLHLEDLVVSMRMAPQAKYVFPLQQGKRREPAIIKDLVSELHSTVKRAGLKFEGSFSRESILALWIAAAIREEIPLKEIRGMIRNLPTVYSFLSILPASEISDSRRIEIMNMVDYSITNKNPGWFVLRLRSGVTPEDIKERLKEKESPIQRQIQYYYPMRSVKKLEKKKVVTVDTPVIPGILFFRLPHDRVVQLVGTIGDLAWCYRTTANSSSPYSVIPQAEMRVFQKCVGIFTADVEMEIVSQLPPLNVGDEVMIEDGSHLDGQIATIRKVRSVDGSFTYTLRLSETAFIKWKDIELPASHLAKV